MLCKLKFLILPLFFTVAVEANTDTPNTDLERLLDVTGINSSIESIPPVLDDEMSNEVLTNQVGDPQLAATINQSIKNNFTKSLFGNAIRDSLTRRLTKREISQQVAWYDTPLGQRIAEAHRQDQYKISVLVANGQRHKVSAKRKALLTKLDVVTMGSDNAQRISIDVSTVMSHSMMTAMGMPISMDQVRAMVTPEMIAEMDTIIDEYHATMAYIYKSLSDDELQQFVSYMARPESTVLCDAIWSGMRVAFHAGGAAMGAELVAELRGAF